MQPVEKLVSWRSKIARKIGLIYAQNPAVDAVLLTGSVGLDDENAYSDIDLVVYRREPPSTAERERVGAQAGAARVVLEETESEPELKSWDDVLYLGTAGGAQLKVDVTHHLSDRMAGVIQQVTVEHDLHRIKLAMMRSILKAVVLHGDAFIADWRARMVPFPEGLAEKLARENLRPPVAGWSFDMLALRESHLLLRDLLIQTGNQVMLVLCGINRVYPPHQFKHLGRLVDELRIKPADLMDRVAAIANGDPDAAVSAVRGLLAATFDLVDAHLPQVDTAEARDFFALERAQLNAPPVTVDDN